mmetsp:Transcript_46188/g.119449  ORF Transcript_46188/g.119449 Transcript_46188/m.119449 type:complete len:279 (-) Transcript_46188:1140-1976(-)
MAPCGARDEAALLRPQRAGQPEGPRGDAHGRGAARPHVRGHGGRRHAAADDEVPAGHGQRRPMAAVEEVLPLRRRAPLPRGALVDLHAGGDEVRARLPARARALGLRQRRCRRLLGAGRRPPGLAVLPQPVLHHRGGGEAAPSPHLGRHLRPRLEADGKVWPAAVQVAPEGGRPGDLRAGARPAGPDVRLRGRGAAQGVQERRGDLRAGGVRAARERTLVLGGLGRAPRQRRQRPAEAVERALPRGQRHRVPARTQEPVRGLPARAPAAGGVRPPLRR